MHRLVKAACAAICLFAPSIAFADYTVQENFATYATGDLVGQHGWLSSGETSIVLTNSPLSSTAGIYGVGTNPVDTASSADFPLGTTIQSGKIYSVSKMRLDVANFDAAGVSFIGIGAYAGAQVNNRFGDGVRVIRDRGGFAQAGDIIGTDADLLHHWFQIGLTIDLDAESITTRVQDMNGAYDHTFVDTLNPSFVADTFEAFTSRSGKMSIVPEPGSLAILAGIGLFTARRRRARVAI
jgi:hypothetical protein